MTEENEFEWLKREVKLPGANVPKMKTAGAADAKDPVKDLTQMTDAEIRRWIELKAVAPDLAEEVTAGSKVK